MKTYNASLDTLSKVVTGIVVVVLVVMLAIVWGYTSISPIETEQQAGKLIAASVVAIFVLSWAFAPQAYRLTPDELIILRPLRPVKIPLNQITQVTQPPMSQFSFMLRLFGSGGFLGYFGLFWASKLGKMWWYATRRNNLIMIYFSEGKPIVISPDDLALAGELQKWVKK
ncbi:hypothetical protein C7N43_26820 [Sphingobacteriales bacterium UPWRP_1]|nr:hypothetical protein BVG80_14860 [Sphingobacteriales bacterium TSM_CSM]PSJ73899.1 hypothetical protein C7N43_26820 [Sphingobacteriales bacterium UPWRP_1]